MAPDNQRYIDPDFTEDLQEASSSGGEWSVMRAVKFGLSGRPVRHCPACGRLVLVGKACCWVTPCMAVFLFNGVGKPLISDESIRDRIAQAQGQTRASERSPEPTPVAPALVVDATEPDVGVAEQLEQANERRYMKLCRILMHSMRGGSHDIGTPRGALVTSIRESYKHRKKWRRNVVLQLGEAEEGYNQYPTSDLIEMAIEGKCHVYHKKGICGAWFPKDRWEQPKEEDYLETPEVDYYRFISGIVDSIEEQGRWEEFIITPTPGLPAPKGSEYRSVVIALASSILWGALGPTWAHVEELQRSNRIDLRLVPDKALRVRSQQ